MSDTKLDITKKQVNLLDTSLQAISSTPRKVYVKMSDGTIQEVPIDATTVNGKTPLPLDGGKMTGDLRLKNNAMAMGSAQLTSTTLSDAYNNELKSSNGLMGSISLAGQESIAGVNIPAGWYNYLYIPHRDGGLDGDDFQYGTLLLSDMTTGNYNTYLITITGGAFTKCMQIPSMAWVQSNYINQSQALALITSGNLKGAIPVVASIDNPTTNSPSLVIYNGELYYLSD